MMKATGLLTGCAMAMAGAALAAPPAVTLQLGAENDYRSAGIGLRLPPVWAGRWGRWDAAAHFELGLNHFRYEEGDEGPRSLDAAGAGASLRLTRGGEGLRPYAEVGLSGNLFTRTHLGPKSLSTGFQFGEYLGAGVQLGEEFAAGWRYAHFSNADLRKPNRGLDFHQIVIVLRF